MGISFTWRTWALPGKCYNFSEKKSLKLGLLSRHIKQKQANKKDTQKNNLIIV